MQAQNNDTESKDDTKNKPNWTKIDDDDKTMKENTKKEDTKK